MRQAACILIFMMTKGLSFLIFVTVALLSLAYEAKTPVTRDVASDSSSTPHAAMATEPLGKSRRAASQAQPLEIEEVEAQN